MTKYTASMAPNSNNSSRKSSPPHSYGHHTLPLINHPFYQTPPSNSSSPPSRSPPSGSPPAGMSLLTPFHRHSNSGESLHHQQHNRMSPVNPPSNHAPGGASTVGMNGVPKPRRDQVQEFFKLVKDGKINEVNQALKSNHQFALCCDDKQNNALYYAASLGDKQMSDILLNSGASVNHQGGDIRSTPLMAAAEKGFSQCCDLYIKSGANVNAENMAGNRALHLAASRGHHDVCRVLIESGAEIGATNGKNLNAINEAQAAQHYNLSDYLRQQMGQRMQPSSTNQMQAGPNMPSRNMGGSNTNGISSLNIGFGDRNSNSRKSPQRQSSSNINGSPNSSSGNSSLTGDYKGFPIGQILNYESENRGTVVGSYSPPEDPMSGIRDPFNIDLPSRSFFESEKSPSKGDIKSFNSVESINAMDVSFAHIIGSKAGLSSSSPSLDSVKSSPNTEIRTSPPIMSLPVSLFSPMSTSKNTPSPSRQETSDLAAGLGIGLQNILFPPSESNPKMNVGHQPAYQNGGRNGSTSNNGFGSQGKIGQHRFSSVNSNHQSQMSKKAWGENGSGTTQDVNGNFYNFPHAPEGIFSNFKKPQFSQSGSATELRATATPSIFDTPGYHSNQQIDALISDIYEPKISISRNQLQDLLKQQQAFLQQNPNQFLSTQNGRHFMGGNTVTSTVNMKSQQMQSQDSLRLQYSQLLINDLSKKNRELEMKLGDTEAQLLNLRFENQQMKMRLKNLNGFGN